MLMTLIIFICCVVSFCLGGVVTYFVIKNNEKMLTQYDGKIATVIAVIKSGETDAAKIKALLK